MPDLDRVLRHPRLRRLLLASILLVNNSTLAQTPWQAAPALPAQVPSSTGTNYPTTRVVSLAPPPGRSSSISGQVATPAYVPLAAPSDKPAGVPGQNGGDMSLVPAGLALPAPQPAAPSPNAFPPLPSFRDLPLPSPTALAAALPAAPRPSTNQVPVSPPSQLVSFDRPEQRRDPGIVEAGTLVAVVGGDRILAGDMAHVIEPIIEQNRDKLRDESDEAQLRTQLTRQVLVQLVEMKALYQEFFRDMVGAGPPKELKDMKKQVTTRAGKIFFEKQVPSMLEKYDATDLTELEMKLREKNMSLLTLRTQFIEQVLASELERKYVPQEFEVSRQELLEDYQANKGQWDIAAKAKWRQLTIRFDKHNNDQAVVDAMIKNLGNQVFLGGAPFEAVARQASEGYTSKDGGVYDWTTKGSLKSKEIDSAIFSLPIGELSQIIVDDIGMHIVEVLAREDGHTEDFTVAQAEIRKKLSDEKRDAAAEKFRAKVLDRTPVWSMWPDDLKGKIKHVRPLTEAIGEQPTQ